VTSLFEELCERIRGEVPELERAVDRALGAWAHAQQTPDEYAYLDSVALNLHAFYSGVERLFELIARHVDRTLPSGDTWHRDLLYQMAGDLPETRPALGPWKFWPYWGIWLSWIPALMIERRRALPKTRRV